MTELQAEQMIQMLGELQGNLRDYVTFLAIGIIVLIFLLAVKVVADA